MLPHWPARRVRAGHLTRPVPARIENSVRKDFGCSDSSTQKRTRHGEAASRPNSPLMGLDRRGCIVQPKPRANWQQEEPCGGGKVVRHASSVCQRPNIGSRVSREVHARIWERLGVRFPRATRHLRQTAGPSGKSTSQRSPDDSAPYVRSQPPFGLSRQHVCTAGGREDNHLAAYFAARAPTLGALFVAF